MAHRRIGHINVAGDGSVRADVWQIARCVYLDNDDAVFVFQRTRLVRLKTKLLHYEEIEEHEAEKEKHTVYSDLFLFFVLFVFFVVGRVIKFSILN